MKTTLFLDDERQPPGEPGTMLVRTPEQFLDMVSRYKFDIWSLDHDLGVEYTDGYRLLKLCTELEFIQWPESIICHSQNPVGKKQIQNFIQFLWDQKRINR